VLGARRLHAALGAAPIGEFRAVMLPEPDINIVCWVMHHPSLKTLDAVNALNEAIYERMSLARPGAQPEYIITRTRFQSPMYDGAVDPLLQALGVCTAAEWKANGASGLVVLRSTVMDPFLVSPPPAPDHVRGFRKALIKAAESALRTVTP
jgi:hypothetical protein